MDIERLLEHRLEFVGMVVNAQQTGVVAPDYWFDESEIGQSFYTEMLDFLQNNEAGAVFDAATEVVEDPLFEEYVNQCMTGVDVEDLHRELELKYGPIFDITENYVFLMQVKR